MWVREIFQSKITEMRDSNILQVLIKFYENIECKEENWGDDIAELSREETPKALYVS